MAKYRRDFVTNSSSSSYVCDICGRSETGMDLGLSDAGMYQCENYHTICEDEIYETPNYKEFLQESIDEVDIDLLNSLSDMSDDELEDLAMDYEFRYYLPEKYCPICNFASYSASDMTSYLVKTRGVTRDEVFVEIKKINKRRKKLYNTEYVQYVCQKFNLTEKDLIDEVKVKFGTYKSFKEFIRG